MGKDVNLYLRPSTASSELVEMDPAQTMSNYLKKNDPGGYSDQTLFYYAPKLVGLGRIIRVPQSLAGMVEPPISHKVTTSYYFVAPKEDWDIFAKLSGMQSDSEGDLYLYLLFNYGITITGLKGKKGKIDLGKIEQLVGIVQTPRDYFMTDPVITHNDDRAKLYPGRTVYILPAITTDINYLRGQLRWIESRHGLHINWNEYFRPEEISGLI